MTERGREMSLEPNSAALRVFQRGARTCSTNPLEREVASQQSGAGTFSTNPMEREVVSQAVLTPTQDTLSE